MVAISLSRQARIVLEDAVLRDRRPRAAWSAPPRGCESTSPTAALRRTSPATSARTSSGDGTRRTWNRRSAPRLWRTWASARPQRQAPAAGPGDETRDEHEGILGHRRRRCHRTNGVRLPRHETSPFCPGFPALPARFRVCDLVGDRRRSRHRPRRHRVGHLRRSRRSIPDGRAGRRRARQGRGGVPGRRRRHAQEPDAGVRGAEEGHRSEADHRAAQPGPGVSEPAVRHPRSAGPQRRTLGTDQRLRVAGHSGPGAGHRRSSIRSRATSCARAASCRTRCRRSSRRKARSPIA